ELELQLAEEEKKLHHQADALQGRKLQIIQEELQLQQQTDLLQRWKQELQARLAEAMRKKSEEAVCANFAKENAVLLAGFLRALEQAYEDFPMEKVNFLLKCWTNTLCSLALEVSETDKDEGEENGVQKNDEEAIQTGRDKTSENQEQKPEEREKKEQRGQVESDKRDQTNPEQNIKEQGHQQQQNGKFDRKFDSLGQEPRRITPLTRDELIAASPSWPWRKRSFTAW